MNNESQNNSKIVTIYLVNLYIYLSLIFFIASWFTIYFMVNNKMDFIISTLYFSPILIILLTYLFRHHTLKFAYKYENEIKLLGPFMRLFLYIFTTRFFYGLNGNKTMKAIYVFCFQASLISFYVSFTIRNGCYILAPLFVSGIITTANCDGKGPININTEQFIDIFNQFIDIFNQFRVLVKTIFKYSLKPYYWLHRPEINTIVSFDDDPAMSVLQPGFYDELIFRQYLRERYKDSVRQNSFRSLNLSPKRPVVSILDILTLNRFERSIESAFLYKERLGSIKYFMFPFFMVTQNGTVSKRWPCTAILNGFITKNGFIVVTGILNDNGIIVQNSVKKITYYDVLITDFVGRKMVSKLDGAITVKRNIERIDNTKHLIYLRGRYFVENNMFFLCGYIRPSAFLSIIELAHQWADMFKFEVALNHNIFGVIRDNLNENRFFINGLLDWNLKTSNFKYRGNKNSTVPLLVQSDFRRCDNHIHIKKK